MFFKNRKPVANFDKEDAVDDIIMSYLEDILLAYKGQKISAERMIEMELDLIAKRNT